jgi:hypothetical protein
MSNSAIASYSRLHVRRIRASLATRLANRGFRSPRSCWKGHSHSRGARSNPWPRLSSMLLALGMVGG